MQENNCLNYHRCLISTGVEKLKSIKIQILTLTTRCLYIRVNVGIQTIVYFFKALFNYHCVFDIAKHFQPSLMFPNQAQCCKTFCYLNLQMFIISKSVCLWQAFPSQSIVSGLGQKPTVEWNPVGLTILKKIHNLFCYYGQKVYKNETTQLIKIFHKYNVVQGWLRSRFSLLIFYSIRSLP